MEPNEMPATEPQRTTRSRSRLKAVVGGLVLARLLVGGSASKERTDTDADSSS